MFNYKRHVVKRIATYLASKCKSRYIITPISRALYTNSHAKKQTTGYVSTIHIAKDDRKGHTGKNKKNGFARERLPLGAPLPEIR